MVLNLQVPQNFNLKPTITVFGVGGAGGNAIGNMIELGVEGVKFVIANTDSQSIENSKCTNAIQLGINVTQGLGAGAYPEVGKAAAEESAEEILDYLQGSNMVFVAAGMGGGTGTGAAPVVARLAREQGILTVGVVTKPFHFEGTHRMRIAELGLQELQKYVDTMIVIPNQNLFRIADKSTTFLDAFKLADSVLKSGVTGITDLMVMPGLINLDFADVRSVMSEMGKAMMGTGEAEGENRAIKAAEAAIANPLLDNVSMQGARGVLINITGGSDMTLFEVDEAANRVREEVDENANIIFGSTFDMSLDGKLRVSVVATGIDADSVAYTSTPQPARITTNKQQPAQPSSNHGSRGDSKPQYFSESDDEDGLTSNTFISREPVEPAIRQPQPQNERFERPNARPGNPAHNSHPQPAQNPGLFGSLFSRKEEEPAQPAQTHHASAPQQQPNRVADDELDIPAYLRRKV